MKIGQEIVENELRGKLPTAQLTSVVASMVEEEKAGREPKEPAPEKPLVLLVGPSVDGEAAGWVFRTEPGEERPVTELLAAVARDFNATRLGRKNPLKTVGDTIQFAPAKAFKRNGLVRLHREPLLVQWTDNSLEVVTAS